MLTFTVPDLDESGRVLWAYATYIGFGILYTVVTIPTALTASSRMTIERTQLSTWRMAFAFAGAGVVTVGVQWLPLFGEALGYQVVMSLFALVATGLLVLAFFHRRSREATRAAEAPLARQYASGVFNGPLMVVIGLFTLGMLSFTVRQTVTIYYFTYNVGRPDLIGLFFGLSLVVMFVGLPFVPLAARFGKAGAMQLGAIFTIVSCVGFYLTPASEHAWVIFWGCLVALGGAPVAVLGWAMIPDTVEYAQWKHGKRADGAVYSSASFSKTVRPWVAQGWRWR